MATLDDLRDLGYDVALAFRGADFTVYRVDGFGISTQIRDGDRDTIRALADSHDERVAQQNETPDETLLRWHEDKDNQFELGEEQARDLRGRLQEGRGS